MFNNVIKSNITKRRLNFRLKVTNVLFLFSSLTQQATKKRKIIAILIHESLYQLDKNLP